MMIAILALALPLAIGAELIKEQPKTEVTYDHNSRTECRGDDCTTVAYTATRYGYENRQWKPIENLRSFKGTTPIKCVVKQDKYITECLDHNATTKTIKITDEGLLYAEKQGIPIRIFEPDNDGKLAEADTITLYMLDSKESILTITSSRAGSIHIGANSTEVYDIDAYFDGHVGETGVYGVKDWSAVRDAVTGDATSATPKVRAQDHYTYNTYIVERAYFPINTTGITDGANITNASFCVDVGFGSGVGRSLGVVQTNQSDPTTLSTGDYSHVGVKEGGARITSISNYAYNCFTLNSTGISWINDTGVSLFGVREGTYDIDNNTPGTNYFQLIDSNRAYLNVTYTAEEPPAGTDCNCSGLNTNKLYNLSDNCYINTDCNMTGGNITWTGSGSWVLNATLTCEDVAGIPADEILNLTGNAVWWLGAVS